MLLMLLMLLMLPPPAVRHKLMLGQGQLKQGAAPPLLGLKCSACSLQVKEPATMEAPIMSWQEKDMQGEMLGPSGCCLRVGNA
jgi:hypothetical protein